MSKTNFNIFLHIPLQEKILFTKNMALALKSGVSLVNSLKMMQGQSKSRAFKKILESLMADANRGVFLSDGLAKFEHVFGPLFINVIRVAEMSGTLPENLIYLGDELAKNQALRKKIRGALVYPIIILIATVIVGASMVIFVFPKILPLFQNSNVPLPLTTRILIAVSNFLTVYGVYALFGLIAFIVGARLLLRLSPVRRIYDGVLFFMPLFGSAIVNYNMANFTRTFALLLRSGIRITEALDITGNTFPNLVYRGYLKETAERVRRGEFMSKFLAGHPRQFPTIAVNLLEVGENTGNLTENLHYLAEFYENEIDDFVKNLSSILEPVLLLIMGSIVGFIALSFITPIYQLTRTIR